MQSLRLFRLVAYIEGLSFVLLVCVAMPLKYWADFPLAVRILGMVHGALFVAFIVLLARAASELAWPAKRWLAAFSSSLVPFGTFAFDPSLRRELKALSSLPQA